MSVAEPAPCGGFWTRTELGFGTGPRIMVSGPFEIVDTRRKLDLRLEMDLAVLINAIKASSSSLVVNRFLKSLIKDMEVPVSHNYRDRNRSADWSLDAL
ncbi:hypothetical protein D5086_015940 [Populus alba]|uniref:Uncharacterized protein n=1 Tax=Populus alba TaxID=43335 RepID=A0ACC4BSM7_POPAL